MGQRLKDVVTNKSENDDVWNWRVRTEAIDVTEAAADDGNEEFWNGKIGIVLISYPIN